MSRYTTAVLGIAYIPFTWTCVGLTSLAHASGGNLIQRVLWAPDPFGVVIWLLIVLLLMAPNRRDCLWTIIGLVAIHWAAIILWAATAHEQVQRLQSFMRSPVERFYVIIAIGIDVLVYLGALAHAAHRLWKLRHNQHS